jgi:hypothetical protein
MTYGAVRADEMQRFGYPDVHRLTVDTYMPQHPGDGTDRRERQSVFVHLAGLCAVLQCGMPARHATDVLRRLLQTHDDFPALRPAPRPAELTVLHLVGAHDLSEYEQRARQWADAVWQSWANHNDVIRHAVASVMVSQQ